MNEDGKTLTTRYAEAHRGIERNACTSPRTIFGGSSFGGSRFCGMEMLPTQVPQPIETARRTAAWNERATNCI